MTKIISHKNILKNNHTPVLYEKVLENLNIRDGLTYVDGTFGAGGHTNMILSSANCNVISIDRDPSVEIFTKKIKNKFPNNFKYIAGNIGRLKFLFSSSIFGKVLSKVNDSWETSELIKFSLLTSTFFTSLIDLFFFKIFLK